MMEVEAGQIVNFLMQWIVAPLIGAIILWMGWLTLKVYDNANKIGINSALDEQTQNTLKEIKAGMVGINKSLTKILIKLKISEDENQL